LNRGAISHRSKVISTSTQLDGRHLEFRESTASDNVRNDSGMVDNVESLAVQKLFTFPVSLAAIVNFGSLPSATSANVRQCQLSSQSRALSKM
jgi:hypothetical protein